MELKGSGNTEIVFSGKARVMHKAADSGWDDAVTGTLTLRKDVPSGKFWLQVNSDQVRLPLMRSSPLSYNEKL